MASSTYEIVATALKTIIDNEFSAESISAIHDNIHEALGTDRIVVGIAPADQGDVVNAANGAVQETWVEVKFYDLWNPKIDPTQTVNPMRITAFADRFRRAVRAARASEVGSDQMWFYDLRQIRYPNDPTGNKTRFVATIRAFSNNSALVETSA